MALQQSTGSVTQAVRTLIKKVSSKGLPLRFKKFPALAFKTQRVEALLGPA